MPLMIHPLKVHVCDVCVQMTQATWDEVWDSVHVNIRREQTSWHIDENSMSLHDFIHSLLRIPLTCGAMRYYTSCLHSVVSAFNTIYGSTPYREYTLNPMNGSVTCARRKVFRCFYLALAQGAVYCGVGFKSTPIHNRLVHHDAKDKFTSTSNPRKVYARLVSFQQPTTSLLLDNTSFEKEFKFELQAWMSKNPYHANENDKIPPEKYRSQAPSHTPTTPQPPVTPCQRTHNSQPSDGGVPCHIASQSFLYDLLETARERTREGDSCKTIAPPKVRCM